MSTHLASLPLRCPNFAASLVVVMCCGCGARSELVVRMHRVEPLDAIATDGAALDARDGTGDATPDRGNPDVAPACPDLFLAAGPVTALQATTGGYATPRLVARAGGFDLLAPATNVEPLGIRARRLYDTPAPPGIRFGDVTIVGEGSWTWAEAGSDGTTLALGYLADAPTFRAWSGEYVSVARTALVLATPSVRCAGIAWAGDRWVTGWGGTPGESWVAELSPAGMLQSPRPAGVDLSASAPSLGAYGHGAAWTAPDSRGGVTVVFAPRGRPDVTQRVPVTDTVRSLRIAAWPPDDSAVALVWREGSFAVHLAVVREDGTRLVDATVIPSAGWGAHGVEVAPFLDGVVIADVSCGDADPTAGRIDVHRIGADGVERGRGAFVPLDCRVSAFLASIAADGVDVALAWLTPQGSPRGDMDVNAALLRCTP
ncbi:MAG: hypothetical protein WCJ30_02030 [Deltaproteobacteria bacterium]